MNGYFGKILHVNLSSGSFSIEEFDESFARNYIGGNGFAARLIADRVPASAGPLAEENMIVFATGPMTGSPVWGTGRGHCAAISPQTGIFGDSNFGGDFAAALKSTGFDAVAITGKSAVPSYLVIDNGQYTIKKADDIWGQHTSATHKILIEKEGTGFQSAVIGPAGENLVPFACVICSGSRVSAAGRCGLGAVMGSKNLKALIARGNSSCDVADREALTALLKSRLPILRDNTKVLTEIGTPVLVKTINDRGMLASRNNTRETFDNWHAISGELIAEKYKVKNTACRRCPVACGKLVNVPSGEYAGQQVKMPEFESIYALATMPSISEIASLFNANTLCDELGLDTISMGVTLAFAAECIEKGIIPEKDFGGFGFGKAEPVMELIGSTAFRRGAGELLSLGSEGMARKLGRNTADFLYSVKGLEIAGHSARGIRPMGLGYATSTRGGSHHDTRPKYTEPDLDPGFDGVPEYCVASQNTTAIGDSLVMCRFVMERGFGTLINDSLAEAVRLVTGFDLTADELSTAGERIYTLERHINTQRSITRKNDTLPRRVMNDPIPAGPAAGRYCPEDELNRLLDAYYNLRGWSADGIPEDDTLRNLSLI